MKIGILGAGQLGRMLALAGIPLGLEFLFYDAALNPPAARVGEYICGAWDDVAALRAFASRVDVVTFEFENVPESALAAIEGICPIHPRRKALATSQERLTEKAFLRDVGIPVPAFAPVNEQDTLLPALDEIGWPAVIKRTRGGYDGKGQAVIHEPAEALGAWAIIGGGPAILERLVPFERELSIIAVRSMSGEFLSWPLVENHHHGGILRWSVAPAPRLSPAMQAEAEGHARRLMVELDYVGVLAIEFFEVGGQLWANEIAPRVHNSGHWTIEGAFTSQFENHLRAIASLPLGPAAERGPSAMVNLIGTLPSRHEMLAVPGARVHLYGKPPRPGRKLGHLTLIATEEAQRDQALQCALRIVGI